MKCLTNRINYLSYYPTEPNTAIVILPVTLAPHSNKMYLEKGIPSLIVNAGGMYGMHLVAGQIEVLEAVPETTVGLNM